MARVRTRFLLRVSEEPRALLRIFVRSDLHKSEHIFDRVGNKLRHLFWRPSVKILTGFCNVLVLQGLFLENN